MDNSNYHHSFYGSSRNSNPSLLPPSMGQPHPQLPPVFPSSTYLPPIMDPSMASSATQSAHPKASAGAPSAVGPYHYNSLLSSSSSSAAAGFPLPSSSSLPSLLNPYPQPPITSHHQQYHQQSLPHPLSLPHGYHPHQFRQYPHQQHQTSYHPAGYHHQLSNPPLPTNSVAPISPPSSSSSNSAAIGNAFRANRLPPLQHYRPGQSHSSLVDQHSYHHPQQQQQQQQHHHHHYYSQQHQQQQQYEPSSARGPTNDTDSVRSLSPDRSLLARPAVRPRTEQEEEPEEDRESSLEPFDEDDEEEEEAGPRRKEVSSSVGSSSRPKFKSSASASATSTSAASQALAPPLAAVTKTPNPAGGFLETRWYKHSAVRPEAHRRPWMDIAMNESIDTESGHANGNNGLDREPRGQQSEEGKPARKRTKRKRTALGKLGSQTDSHAERELTEAEIEREVKNETEGEGENENEDEGEEEGDKEKKKGKKRRNRAVNGGDSLTCHQCRGYYESGLRCSRTKGPKLRQCNLVFCDRCAAHRYNIDPELVKSSGPPTERETLTLEALSELDPSQIDPQIQTHAPGAKYKWTCPSCDEICQCSICRKRRGLVPLGNLSHAAKKAAGLTTREVDGVEDVVRKKEKEKKIKNPSRKRSKLITPSPPPSESDVHSLIDRTVSRLSPSPILPTQSAFLDLLSPLPPPIPISTKEPTSPPPPSPPPIPPPPPMPTPTAAQKIFLPELRDVQKRIRKEESRREKLMLAAKARLEMLREKTTFGPKGLGAVPGVEGVPIRNVRRVEEEESDQEEDEEAEEDVIGWEDEVDESGAVKEGLVGRVELREFFWRFSTLLPIPDKVFDNLEQVDRPIQNQTVRKLFGTMFDYLCQQLPELDEEEEEEDDIQAREREIYAIARKRMKSNTTIPMDELSKTMSDFVTSLRNLHLPPSSIPSIASSSSLSMASMTGTTVTAPSSRQPLTTKTNNKSTGGGKKGKQCSTLSILLQLSHQILESPDARQVIDEGLQERSEVARVQTKEAKLSLEEISALENVRGRQREREKEKEKERERAKNDEVKVDETEDADISADLSTSMDVKTEQEVEELKKIADLEQEAERQSEDKETIRQKIAEAHHAHLRLLAHHRSTLSVLLVRSSAVLPTDLKNRTYVHTTPTWEAATPEDWGFGVRVYGPPFGSEKRRPGKERLSENGNGNHAHTLEVEKEPEEGGSRTKRARWARFSTSKSIRLLQNLISYEAIDEAVTRGDLLLMHHPSMLSYLSGPANLPEEVWQPSDTLVGEYAAEGKVKRLVKRLGEIADDLEIWEHDHPSADPSDDTDDAEAGDEEVDVSVDVEVEDIEEEASEDEKATKDGTGSIKGEEEEERPAEGRKMRSSSKRNLRAR